MDTRMSNMTSSPALYFLAHTSLVRSFADRVVFPVTLDGCMMLVVFVLVKG